MRAWNPIAIVALSLLAGTPPEERAATEERAEQAREAVRQGLARGDRAAALGVVEELRDSLPATADSLLEVAQLLVRAGDAPRAACGRKVSATADWLAVGGVQGEPDSPC